MFFRNRHKKRSICMKGRLEDSVLALTLAEITARTRKR